MMVSATSSRNAIWSLERLKAAAPLSEDLHPCKNAAPPITVPPKIKATLSNALRLFMWMFY
jgi:hypothetical protein